MSYRGRPTGRRAAWLTVALFTWACDTSQEPMGPEAVPAPTTESPSYARMGRPAVAICHRSHGTRYVRITVADRAVPKHLEHGDALIGEPVPDQPGMVFDGNCQPAPPAVTPLLPEAGAVLDNGCSIASDPIVWNFDWSEVPGATRYHLFVMGGTATIPLVDDASLTASEFRFEGSGYIIDGNRLGWTWKVRAYLGGGWGPWSEERIFDVEPLNTDCA